MKHPKYAKKYLILILLISIGINSVIMVQIIRWEAYIWLPNFITDKFSAYAHEHSKSKHIIFVMVDHFEPGRGKPGADKTYEWIEDFKVISNQHYDSYGNKFRYSWFYPYDHHNEVSLKLLADAVFDDFGEVELHWHHPTATNESFPGMLAEALKWYQSYGLLLSSGEKVKSSFAFIHGSWGLDDSYEWISGGHPRRCGVRRELDILKDKGCYADFTFPSFGNAAQPRISNMIYYVTDSPEPKSYDSGQIASVGRIPGNQEFMLLQGPLGIDWLGAKFEYGAVEYYDIPTKRRIQQWIDSNIHVKGKPEWVFVKVYSHGMQSKEVILKEHMIKMFKDLKDICDEKKYSLHFMTAREAYNLVKAAENGESGDPELYRDYYIKKPCAALLNSNMPIDIQSISSSKVSFNVAKSDKNFSAKLRVGNIKAINGKVDKFNYDVSRNNLFVSLSGDVEIEATKKLIINMVGSGKMTLRQTSLQ